MNENHITFVTISVPRLNNLKRLIPAVLNSVDKVIVVIGVKEEESIKYLKSLGDKVLAVYNPWPGDFYEQFNVYLPYVSGGWVLICDDDEVPSPELLTSLPSLIQGSNYGQNYDVVAFRCEMVGHGYNETHNRTDKTEVYYREIFFRWNPNLRYAVEAHQSLQGLRGPQLKREEKYLHIKDEVDLWRNACRQFFVAGRWDDDEGRRPITQGVRGPEWEELHDILKRNHPEVRMFPDLHRLMISGKVCQEFRDWTAKYRDTTLPSSGELKAYYKYQTYLDSLPMDAEIKQREVIE